MSPPGFLQYLHAEDPTDLPVAGEVPVFGTTGYVPTAGINGNVTASGTLTSNELVIGQGTKAIATLGSLGTTVTLLHGNAAGAPTFATVIEADITLADNTTNNATTGAHGFLKKLDNNAAHFMDGTGNWGTPSGAGNVTHTGTLTSGTTIIGNGSADITVSSLTATVVKSSSGTLSAATAGTDYNAPTTPGTIRQIVNTQTGAQANGTGIIPFDDTIPQKTEGDEYMTLSITPFSSSNKLKIDVVIWTSPSAGRFETAALFQDAGNDALAAMTAFQNTITCSPIVFTHYMTAGTTSATTFKVRAGGDTATTTTTVNGQSAGRKLGGVAASSITITEIVP